MAPKKKFQKMALQDFFVDPATSGSSWAEDDIDLPTAPAARADSGLKRGDAGYLDSMPDRGSRFFGGAPSQREEVPLPTVPPFTAFLGNISFEPDVEEAVRDFFQDLHPVSVRIVKDQAGKSKGFGYVEFSTQDVLKEALDRSMSQLQGRSIRINVAEAPSSTSRHAPSVAEEASQWRRATPLPARRDQYFGEHTSGGGDLDWSAARGAKFVAAPPTGPPGGRDFGNRADSGAGRAREPREPSLTDGVDKWRSNKPMAELKAERDTPPHYAAADGPASAGAGRESGASSPSLADKEEVWTRGSKLRTPTTSNLPSLQGSVDHSPALSPAAPAPPTERRKLNLAPRSAAPAVSSPTSPSANPGNASIFGAAKPVDSAAREQAAEEKLAQQAEERKKAREAEREKIKAEEEKGRLLQEEKLRSIRAATAAAGGAAPQRASGPRQGNQTQRGGPARKQSAGGDKKKDQEGFETVSAPARSAPKPASGPKADYSTRPQFSFAAAAGSLRNELVEGKEAEAEEEAEEARKGVEEVTI